ncbi:HtaA domain-containing protein [Streptomyces sp. NPDC001889]
MPATRRPLVLAAAAATAAALGASALALPAVAADTSKPAAPAASAPSGSTVYQLEAGRLDWGFKKSFREYVKAENITVADGAEQAAGNGPFGFTDGTGTYDLGTHVNKVAFRGSVLFSARHFSLKLSDVRMISDREAGTIQGDITLDGKTTQDVPIADLDMTKATKGSGGKGEMLFGSIPATLTAEGAEAFLNYPEGEVLDTVSLSVKTAGGGTRPSPSTSTSPAPDPETEPETEPEATTSASPAPSHTKNPGFRPEAKPSGGTGSSGGPAARNGVIADGNLDWGLMERWRKYVSGPIAHGKAELADGAVKSGDLYRFTKGTGTFDAGTKTLAASFDGSVRFLGHLKDGAYGLDLTMSGIEVRASGTKGSIVVDVRTKSRDTGKVSVHKDVELGALTIPAGGLKAENNIVKLTAVPGKLTAEGARKGFEDLYEVNEPLDPITLAVSLDKDTEVPDTSGGSDGGSTGGGSTGGTTGGSTGSGTGSGTTGSGTTGGSGSVGGSTGGGTTGGTTGGATGGSTGGSTSGALASTGADLPATALIAASAGIVAAGAGVVFAVRRRGTGTTAS